MDELRKIITFDFWFSAINIRNTVVHIIVGSAIFFFMWEETAANVMLSAKVLIIFALTIEIVQWVQRDFTMKDKWADTIRDFLTYFIIPLFFYVLR